MKIKRYNLYHTAFYLKEYNSVRLCTEWETQTIYLRILIGKFGWRKQLFIMHILVSWSRNHSKWLYDIVYLIRCRKTTVTVNSNCEPLNHCCQYRHVESQREWSCSSDFLITGNSICLKSKTFQSLLWKHFNDIEFKPM